MNLLEKYKTKSKLLSSTGTPNKGKMNLFVWDANNELGGTENEPSPPEKDRSTPSAKEKLPQNLKVMIKFTKYNPESYGNNEIVLSFSCPEQSNL